MDFDEWYRVHETVVLFLNIYASWFIPFLATFSTMNQYPISPASLCGILAIDIALAFYLKHLYKNTTTNNHTLISKFLFSSFSLDLAATFLLYALSSHYYFSFLLSLYRYKFLSTFFSRLERNGKFNYSWVRFAKILLAVWYIVHCNGCIFYRVSTQYRDSASTSMSQKYITSIYGALTTFVNLGIGDIHPIRIEEMILYIFYMTFKFFFVPGFLMAAVRGAVTSLHSMRRSLLRHHFYDTVRGDVYLFRNTADEWVYAMVGELQVKCFLPGEDIIQQNEIPSAFYIVVDGAVDQFGVTDGVQHATTKLTRGALCGEIGVLFDIPQPFTIRARKKSILLRVKSEKFVTLVQTYGNAHQIISDFLRFLSYQRDIREFLEDANGRLPRTREDLQLNLFSAVSRGDVLLLCHMLEWGWDPNEMVINGHTALDIATLQGMDLCASILSAFGANQA